MGGMIPGVEHARRRRRFHQRGGNNNSRRSSFCLYTNNYDQFHISSTSFKQVGAASNACQDEKLVEIAREAKKRLDQRLSAQWKSKSKRRRRFHQRRGNNWLNSPSTTSSFSSIRRFFCLYTSNYDQHHLSSSSSKQKSAASHAYQDAELVEISREAKQRLDQRLSAKGKSESKRSINDRQNRQGLVYKEVFGLKESVSKRFINWAKMGWKSSEQDECAICLDKFGIMGHNLMQLPCAHRFHSKCLLPWLESNSNCPCCRTEILITL